MTRLLAIVCLLALTSCESLWLSGYRHRGGGYGASLPANQPLLVPILHEGTEKYHLVRAWRFSAHEVPKGLIVDGASVPRLCWPFMPPDGLHRPGALAHDWIYQNRGHLPDGSVYSRAQADCVFKDLMLAHGVGRIRAGIAYQGVRLGGWHAWNASTGRPVVVPVEEEDASLATLQTRRRTILSHVFAP